MSNMQLHTYSGRMDLIYLKELPLRIVRSSEEHYGNHLVYSTVEKNGFINKVTVPYKDYYTMTSYNRMILSKQDNMAFHDEVFRASCIEIMESIKVLTAKTMPSFFLKDLTLDAIDQLSKVHLMEYGNSDACGVHIELGPEQKFFVICDPEDFKFHSYSLREAMRDQTIFRGALAHYKPDKFIMGRYENLEYIKELSARVMYQKLD